MLLLIVLFAISTLLFLSVYLWRYDGGVLLFSGFLAFWAFARFPDALPVELIYDPGVMYAFQHSLPGPPFDGFHPYAYPPTYLLYLRPLAGFDYLSALGAWTAATFLAYAAAAGHDRWSRDWRSPGWWLAIVAPSTILEIISGQNGMLTAALIAGAFRLLARRPVLAGLALGCLSFKPQLLLLVPVVLVAARQWRSLLALAASTLALALAAALAFGPQLWLRWIEAAPLLWQVYQGNWADFSHLQPTVTSALLELGMSRNAAQAVQLVVTLGVASCLWMMFRRSARLHGAPTPVDIAALMTGVFLATPYAFLYDMPMVSIAVATTMERGFAIGRPWRTGEMSVLIAALLLPIALATGALAGFPIGPAILLALLAVIIRVGVWVPAPASPAAMHGATQAA